MAVDLRRRFAPVKIFGFLFLLGFAVMIVLPFLYLFASSLKTMGQYYKTDFVDVWFPWPLHFENYARAMTMVDLPRYMLNSVFIGVVQTLFSVSGSAIVAFGFSRFKFRGREAIFLVLLSTMMLPAQVTSIPLYLFFAQIRWTNTYLPLFIPCLFGSAWHIFLIRQFMGTIPAEMEEAALLDGCHSFQIFMRIILPQIVPVLFVSALFQFLYSWKDLWGPLIYLKNNKLYPLTVGLLLFESPTDVERTVKLAAVVISLIPTLVFFIFGKKYLEQGIHLKF